MVYIKKPRVAVVAIRGTQLEHPIEAMVTRRKFCAYCGRGGFYPSVFFHWGDYEIGKVRTTYTGACSDCVTLEDE